MENGEQTVEIGGQTWLLRGLPLLLSQGLIDKWVETHVESLCNLVNEEGKFVPAVLILSPHPDNPNFTIQFGTGIWKFLAPSASEDGEGLRGTLRNMIVKVIDDTSAGVVCLSIPAFVSETPEARERIAASKHPDGSINRDEFADDDEVYEVIYFTTETPTDFTARMFIIERDETDRAEIACELEPNEFQLSLLPRYMKGAQS